MFHIPAHKQVSPAAAPSQQPIPVIRFEHLDDYGVFRRMPTEKDPRRIGELVVELECRLYH